jgi:DNA-binding MarR family transcriptional regulator
METQRSQLLRKLSLTLRTLMWQGHKQTVVSVERLGLTVPQMAVLFALDESGGRTTMSDLVRLTHQSGATLTGIVDRLIGAGFVDRDRDPNDRRVVQVVLSDAGRAKLADVAAQRERDIARMSAALSETELEQLEYLLDKVAQGMDELLAHPVDQYQESVT